MNIFQDSQINSRFLYFQKERNTRTYRTIDFILLTLFVLFNAGAAPQIKESLFTVGAFLFSLGIFILRNKKVDKFLYMFVFLWCGINAISFFINKIDNIGFESFLGVTLRMLMPYFIVKSVGGSFFDKLFNYTFPLVLLSLPLFALEQLFPPLFSAIAPFFAFMTGDQQIYAGGFYSFVFMHNGWGWLEFRNSGFMWEPGGFSCIAIFLLYYYWFRKGIVIDKKVIIILLAIISTFSTAGYIAVFFAVILYIRQNNSLRKNPIIILPLAVMFISAGIYFYKTSDFMSNKIDTYIDDGTRTREWSFGDDEMIRVSRYGIFVISIENALKKPWGEGVTYSDYIIKKYGKVYGPSSLSELLRQWGWLGWLMLYLALIYFVRIFYDDWLLTTMFIISMSAVLFSNPFHFKYLIYGIIFYSFAYRGFRINRK